VTARTTARITTTVTAATAIRTRGDAFLAFDRLLPLIGGGTRLVRRRCLLTLPLGIYVHGSPEVAAAGRGEA
jgi:hypothetical protein